jgi:shikimate dehydrogenase
MASRAFVIGHPVAHSRSPAIHGFWLRRHGIEGSYERIDVAPEELAGFLAGLPDGPLIGGNITIPHKEAALAAGVEADETARTIGAVNTVWIEEGRVHGTNTDAYGFAASLDQDAPAWRGSRIATVLGAGGAARAVLHALAAAGIGDIRIVNRNLERARKLADALGAGISVHGWENVDEALSASDLLVNTTSLGMGGTAMPELDLGRMSESAVVTDIVYVPLETPLLARAREAGLATVDGLGMLLHQAVPGFERWFGVRPTVDAELRRHVLSDLGFKP